MAKEGIDVGVSRLARGERRPTRAVWALAVWGVLVGTPVSASERDVSEGIEPPDVYRLTLELHAELERVRAALKAEVVGPSLIQVREAAPREVYFQARALFDRANELCFDQARELTRAPGPPAATPRPADVYEVVQAALGRVRCVARALDLQGGSDPQTRDETKTPSDVFLSILRAKRQLNRLVESPLSEREAFQEVTLAVALLARLIAEEPGRPRIPLPPPLDPARGLGDAHAELIRCFERVRALAPRYGATALILESSASEGQAPTPADVHELAGLVVSELVHLHAQRPQLGPALLPVDPGPKSPAQVYQRVQVLSLQLSALEQAPASATSAGVREASGQRLDRVPARGVAAGSLPGGD